jgi:hypothetical protein
MISLLGLMRGSPLDALMIMIYQYILNPFPNLEGESDEKHENGIE